jgi:hypothetical protein
MELLHRRCCGLDVHKETVVACLRLVSDGKVTTEVRTFQTTTADLLRLSVYCGPVLRHPAELMLPAVDLGGRVWLGGKPCKGGPAAPAFGG